MQKPKEKRKNDEAQNPIVRYYQWLIDGFRAHRLIYFLPVLILIALILISLLFHTFPMQYAYQDHVIYPVLALTSFSTRFFVYILASLVGIGIFFVKARGYLSLIILTIPIGFLMWIMGGMFVMGSSAVETGDSIIVGNYLYRASYIFQIPLDENDIDSQVEYIIYRCDSEGIQCEPMKDGSIPYYSKNHYVELGLELHDRQLHLLHTDTWRDKRLVTTVDLD